MNLVIQNKKIKKIETTKALQIQKTTNFHEKEHICVCMNTSRLLVTDKIYLLTSTVALYM